MSLVIGVASCLVGSTAFAQNRPRPQTTKFSANKTFGLGFMVGDPLGLAGKYYLTPSTAVDFGFGVIRLIGDDAIHVHADFLWHPAVVAETPPFILPIYFGLGGRMASIDRGRDDIDDDEFALGLRVPGGIMMDFNEVPLDVFLEMAFVLDFVSEGDISPGFNVALGVRYYFK